ncbi:hypothetical protein QBC38DRAFT_249065 [Podospora fimiseda]|uniref:Plasmid pRiA4b Orf3-like domain-containing protein n=1 Tax=Podospora fimiseda TaxID=252190 RepID=A0AAN7BMD3_9PEZI|nr:hypothetical protein QBC38DRAFT_249065 [Podospora fimiseda]
MMYTYDFGDNWEHLMTVEGRAPVTHDFICLSGEGHGVAEDVSSAQGWEALKAAYRAESPSKKQKEKMEWYEKRAVNGDREGLRGDRVKLFELEKVK